MGKKAPSSPVSIPGNWQKASDAPLGELSLERNFFGTAAKGGMGEEEGTLFFFQGFCPEKRSICIGTSFDMPRAGLGKREGGLLGGGGRDSF